MSRGLIVLSFVVGLVPSLGSWEVKAEACAVPAAMTDGWSMSTPEAAGFDPARLCALDTFLEQWPGRNIHGVVVVRGGKLVMERYFAGADERWGKKLGVVPFAPDVRQDVKSVSKSVTSLLVGIARGAKAGSPPSIRPCSSPSPSWPTCARRRRCASPSATC